MFGDAILNRDGRLIHCAGQVGNSLAVRTVEHFANRRRVAFQGHRRQSVRELCRGRRVQQFPEMVRYSVALSAEWITALAGLPASSFFKFGYSQIANLRVGFCSLMLGLCGQGKHDERYAKG